MTVSTTDVRTAPPMVRVALGALVLTALFGLLRAATTVLFYDDLLQAVIDDSSSFRGTDLAESRAFAEAIAPRYRPIALVGGALFGLLLLGCAAGVLARRAWARWVGVGLCALTVLGGLVVLVQPSIAVVTAAGLLTALAAAVALGALLTGQVGRWVSRRSPTP